MMSDSEDETTGPLGAVRKGFGWLTTAIKEAVGIVVGAVLDAL